MTLLGLGTVYLVLLVGPLLAAIYLAVVLQRRR